MKFMFNKIYRKIFRNVIPIGNKLFVEIQKLGDYDGYYKDWSMKKYMQTCMKSVTI